jgi:beta-fructofuranosidase
MNPPIPEQTINVERISPLIKRRQFVGSLMASVVSGLSLSRLVASDSGEKASPPMARLAPPLGDLGAVDEARDFFYRPKDAWTGDFIPYYKDGVFHLFFLLNWRDKASHGEGTPWYQITTRDFVHFTEHGEMLPRGSKDEQDLYVFTGSVVHGEGRYHIFYTGHNFYFPAQNKPEQAIMHAVSDDLLHWKKVPEDTFYAPPDQFERDDWRDPFVFWNEEAGEYWMLVAARLKTGPSRRRGCTGLCTSKDLKKWTVKDPFWAPNLYYAHECPDLFQIGDWWYLVFSEFDDLNRTRYRMSRSCAGPWITPKDDCFDARAFYAAKSATDGRDRFLFGWDPTRSEKTDSSPFDWGGNLVVHRLSQDSDGTLSVGVPPSVDAAWTRPLKAEFSSLLGQVEQNGDQLQISAPESFACAAAGMMPSSCKIEAQVQFEPGTKGCGVILRTGDDLEASYYLRLEPQNNRVVFDRWPRNASYGDHLEGLDRWIPLEPGATLDLKVIADRTLAVVYVGSRVAMSLRMYDLPTGRWGFFVNQGAARFKNISILVP